MNKPHIDSELYEILHFTPEANSEIQDKIDNAYEQIRNGKTRIDKTHINKGKKLRKVIYPAVAAAVILLLGFIGFSNPALAAKIPLVGRIFKEIETKNRFPGNYSERATIISNPENSENETSPDSEINPYSQTSGNITITLSEVVCTDLALYVSLEIYNEEGFPEELNRVKNPENWSLPYNMLYLVSGSTFDFSTQELSGIEPYIYGDYVDSHTFLGTMRIEMDLLCDIAGLDTLPEEFTYSLEIIGVWGLLPVSNDAPDSSHWKRYEGLWQFTFPVVVDRNDTQIKEIMETNVDGIGIARVIKTPYEIKAELILPDALPGGSEPALYSVIITDAEGKALDSQGNVVEVYSLYGRNTDTVDIYIIDTWNFNAPKDWLDENAVFHTTVTW